MKGVRSVGEKENTADSPATARGRESCAKGMSTNRSSRKQHPGEEPKRPHDRVEESKEHNTPTERNICSPAFMRGWFIRIQKKGAETI